MKYLKATPLQNGNAVTIDVAEASGYAICVASEDGEKLFHQIAAALKAGKHVILSFKNVEETTPAFMDNAIGQLYEHFPAEEIEKKISVVDFDSEVEDDIDSAIYWTKRYLENPERLKQAIIKVLGEDYV